MKIEYYILPSSWASALINGDVSGMADEEEEALDKFTVEMVERHGQCWCLTNGPELGFLKYHDAHHVYPYAADCNRFVFDVTPRGDSL